MAKIRPRLRGPWPGTRSRFRVTMQCEPLRRLKNNRRKLLWDCLIRNTATSAARRSDCWAIGNWKTATFVRTARSSSLPGSVTAAALRWRTSSGSWPTGRKTGAGRPSSAPPAPTARIVRSCWTRSIVGSPLPAPGIWRTPTRIFWTTPR